MHGVECNGTLRVMVIASEKLPDMGADELRQTVQSLLKTLTLKQATIDKLTHANALLKRLKFAAQSERFSAEQRSLLEETLDEDLQSVNDEIEQLQADDCATQAQAVAQAPGAASEPATHRISTTNPSRPAATHPDVAAS